MRRLQNERAAAASNNSTGIGQSTVPVLIYTIRFCQDYSLFRLDPRLLIFQTAAGKLPTKFPNSILKADLRQQRSPRLIYGGGFNVKDAAAIQMICVVLVKDIAADQVDGSSRKEKIGEP